MGLMLTLKHKKILFLFIITSIIDSSAVTRAQSLKFGFLYSLISLK